MARGKPVDETKGKKKRIDGLKQRRRIADSGLKLRLHIFKVLTNQEWSAGELLRACEQMEKWLKTGHLQDAATVTNLKPVRYDP